MKKLTLPVLVCVFFALGIVSPIDYPVHSEEAETPDQKSFPVIVDFESPRDFGFHVGDEIPLTITMKVKKGNILDLVNLPKEKESHGPFEVRGVRIKKRQKRDQTEYRVSYNLQSFEPAIAVDGLTFPHLRISYATDSNWNR